MTFSICQVILREPSGEVAESILKRQTFVLIAKTKKLQSGDEKPAVSFL